MKQVSIVIIGKNEEDAIGRSIESVLNGIRMQKNYEAVYVDSCSSDRTVEIAKQFPITILQLKSDWVHSPAAGRYIGYLNTSGRYIFFLDGDSTMDKTWLSEAVSFLNKNPRAAGVSGIIHEHYMNQKNQTISKLTNKYNQQKAVESVKLLAGPAVYRRKILNEVGPFHPFIFCDEERELSLRIREKGYQLYRVLKPMAVKYGPPRDSFEEIASKMNRNLYSLGVTWRYCLHEGFFWQFARERMGFVFKFLLMLAVSGSLIIYLSIMRQWFLLAGFIAILVFGAILMAIKRKSIKSVIVSLIKRTVIGFNTIYTFFTTKVKSIDEYPREAIFVHPYKKKG